MFNFLVACIMYLFVGKLLFVDSDSTVPVSHYSMTSEARPFRIPRTKVTRPVYGSANGVWLFLTFLFCCFVFFLNELNTNRGNLVFVILKLIQLYK